MRLAVIFFGMASFTLIKAEPLPGPLKHIKTIAGVTLTLYHDWDCFEDIITPLTKIGGGETPQLEWMRKSKELISKIKAEKSCSNDAKSKAKEFEAHLAKFEKEMETFRKSSAFNKMRQAYKKVNSWENFLPKEGRKYAGTWDDLCIATERLSREAADMVNDLQHVCHLTKAEGATASRGKFSDDACSAVGIFKEAIFPKLKNSKGEIRLLQNYPKREVRDAFKAGLNCINIDESGGLRCKTYRDEITHELYLEQYIEFIESLISEFDDASNSLGRDDFIFSEKDISCWLNVRCDQYDHRGKDTCKKFKKARSFTPSCKEVEKNLGRNKYRLLTQKQCKAVGGTTVSAFDRYWFKSRRLSVYAHKREYPKYLDFGVVCDNDGTTETRYHCFCDSGLLLLKGKNKCEIPECSDLKSTGIPSHIVTRLGTPSHCDEGQFYSVLQNKIVVCKESCNGFDYEPRLKICPLQHKGSRFYCEGKVKNKPKPNERRSGQLERNLFPGEGSGSFEPVFIDEPFTSGDFDPQ